MAASGIFRSSSLRERVPQLQDALLQRTRARRALEEVDEELRACREHGVLPPVSLEREREAKAEVVRRREEHVDALLREFA